MVKILIEESDKNYMTEQTQREFIALLRNYFSARGYKRGLADFDVHNNTLIKFSPDIVDMQEAEEKFQQKWFVREAEIEKEESLEEFIDNE